MKNFVALLLALVMVLSLAACGGNSATPASESIVELSVGDTATTDKMEFILKRCEFTEIVDYATHLGTEFRDLENDPHLLPLEQSKVGLGYQSASEGNILISITFTLSNVGKEAFSDYPKLTIDYDNGYTFESTKFECRTYNNEWGNVYKNKYLTGGNDYITIQPLSEAREVRGYFDVPLDTQKNADKELKLIVPLENADGTIIEYIYNLR